MSDRMRPLPFGKLLEWISAEIEKDRTLFGIPRAGFFRAACSPPLQLFGRPLDNPIGPAAGPHTQLAQNIITAFVAGGRFFELKTVQKLDGVDLKVDKPCISAADEGYNVEWSTELTVQAAYEEYVKAWFILHFLSGEFSLSPKRGFIFNMSVGYDLDGIRSPKIDTFIDDLTDASRTAIWKECKDHTLNNLGLFKNITREYVEKTPPGICSSITLSTLHGCPSAEIERIARHLLGEKRLHTFVKLNPTLLGYEFVRENLDRMGYGYLDFDEHHFQQDLQFAEAVSMLARLKDYAGERDLLFGVKLTNTFPVEIKGNELPGREMYMSGRALYPLTINLAYRLAKEFGGDLKMSYSGGAGFFNLGKLYETGIWPITLATTLLKPGGYLRLKQMADSLAEGYGVSAPARIDLEKLRVLAESAVMDPEHLKAGRETPSAKPAKHVPLTDCFIAPCREGCPIEQDVPRYLHLVAEGQYREALAVILARNPLPFITGTLCNHRCTTRCTRINYDEPLNIRAAKLLAAERAFADYLGAMQEPARKSRIKVAVIGAGPAGLSAGYFLRRAGFPVTVFDRRHEIGGLVGQVIPGFRIAREAIDRDLELIRKTGVQFRLGVGADFSVEALKREGYKFVFIAIGAWQPDPLPLEAGGGEILNVLEFLEAYNHAPDTLRIGKDVVVIGGGNSAMDAARAAKRVAGVRNVRLIYRRTREYAPAAREELDLALADGVEFRELLAPVAYSKGILQCQRMELGAPDASGRKSPVAIPGAFVDLPADSVVAAVGEKVDPEPLLRNGIALDARGRAIVDPATDETNVANVFIGGDALRGPATIVEAIADGLKFAETVMAREGAPRAEPWADAADFHRDRRIEAGRSGRGILRHALGPGEEGKRCLQCGLICNICAEVCPNRANIAIDCRTDLLRCRNQIVHLDGPCNECGNCATFCPYDGAPYRDKLTLFWRQEDFADSRNNGFVLLDETSRAFRIRLEGGIVEISFDGTGKCSGNIPEEVADLIWATYRDYGYLFSIPIPIPTPISEEDVSDQAPGQREAGDARPGDDHRRLFEG